MSLNEMAAVRVIAKVLDDGAAVGVSVRGAQLIVGGVGEARQQQRADALLPSRIDDGLVRENGVGLAASREASQQEQ